MLLFIMCLISLYGEIYLPCRLLKMWNKSCSHCAIVAQNFLLFEHQCGFPLKFHCTRPFPNGSCSSAQTVPDVISAIDLQQTTFQKQCIKLKGETSFITPGGGLTAISHHALTLQAWTWLFRPLVCSGLSSWKEGPC